MKKTSGDQGYSTMRLTGDVALALKTIALASNCRNINEWCEKLIANGMELDDLIDGNQLKAARDEVTLVRVSKNVGSVFHNFAAMSNKKTISEFLASMINDRFDLDELANMAAEVAARKKALVRKPCKLANTRP